MRYNSILHIFPEQCAKYLHDKFRMHSELTIRELMAVLKHMGIKTVKIHNNGKIYDVFYKRIIDGIQDFEFLNNLHEYRRIKQIKDEWSKESPENYDPELSNMQNASNELLRQDDVYYTNETKTIKYNNMKKDNKKTLYESIMTSVAKEVKKTLNESVEDEKILNEKLDNWTEEDFKRVGDKVGAILARNNLDLTSTVIDILKWGNPEQIKLFTQAMRKANTKYAIQMSKLDY